MTQLQSARSGETTRLMNQVAGDEGLDPASLRRKIADGLVVIPANRRHTGLRPIGVGEGLRTKVNANLGTSPDRSDLEKELSKLRVSLRAGADTVMDLSTGGDIDAVRRAIMAESPAPVGTVPIYQAAIEAGGPGLMSAEGFLSVFERHARDGVDFATVHAGVTRDAIPLLEKRLMGVVSRGGSFLVRWMRRHERENFLYECFDEILAIAREYDVTMSLGDGLRPGCVADATDRAQLHELEILGELAARCRQQGVQVMIEGPGHVPLDQVPQNVRLEKEHCDRAPFYVLGPLPTDIAPGYDHLVGAIGGALAAAHGADFLCYVTPKEHVGLPDEEDVRLGVIASRIAAHVGDVAKGIPGAAARDATMSRLRADRDWDGMVEHALDPQTFAHMLATEEKTDRCSMCGEFCAVKLFREAAEEADPTPAVAAPQEHSEGG